ncbi:MAG: hypothetical protein RIR18_97 [Pseudomonadota bacterium]|jgi:uncharacterized membrane protein (DUF485 family)
MQDINEKIQANPKFQKFVSMRNGYSIIMTVLMIVVYFGYILLIAFNKEWLATKLVPAVTQVTSNPETGEAITTIISAGTATSYGIPLGVGVIVFTILLTNIYVRRANTEFDTINAEIIKEAQQ